MRATAEPTMRQKSQSAADARMTIAEGKLRPVGREDAPESGLPVVGVPAWTPEGLSSRSAKIFSAFSQRAREGSPSFLSTRLLKVPVRKLPLVYYLNLCRYHLDIHASYYT